jgi:glutamate dehydrogenase/leucine dehydrogenase
LCGAEVRAVAKGSAPRRRERQQQLYDRIEREFREERHRLIGPAEDVLAEDEGEDDGGDDDE